MMAMTVKQSFSFPVTLSLPQVAQLRIPFGESFQLVSSQLRIKSGFSLPQNSRISARKLASTWGLGGEHLLK
jgi:hypothetical protein